VVNEEEKIIGVTCVVGLRDSITLRIVMKKLELATTTSKGLL
jgi:hypothetical protein